MPAETAVPDRGVMPRRARLILAFDDLAGPALGELVDEPHDGGDLSAARALLGEPTRRQRSPPTSCRRGS
jgi:hypothetical protein